MEMKSKKGILQPKHTRKRMVMMLMRMICILVALSATTSFPLFMKRSFTKEKNKKSRQNAVLLRGWEYVENCHSCITDTIKRLCYGTAISTGGIIYNCTSCCTSSDCVDIGDPLFLVLLVTLLLFFGKLFIKEVVA